MCWRKENRWIASIVYDDGINSFVPHRHGLLQTPFRLHHRCGRKTPVEFVRSVVNRAVGLASRHVDKTIKPVNDAATMACRQFLQQLWIEPYRVAYVNINRIVKLVVDNINPQGTKGFLKRQHKLVATTVRWFVELMPEAYFYPEPRQLLAS